METTTEKLILKELREIKTELQDTNKRLDVTNERIDDTNKILDVTNERIDDTNKILDDTNKRLDVTNEKLDNTNKRLDGSNERIVALEEGRVKDRRDILVVLDTMQKSISDQFTEMREYMDSKFEKIFAQQRINDLEHEEFKKLLYAHNRRLDFHSSRLSYLEKWKADFDMGKYTAV